MIWTSSLLFSCCGHILYCTGLIYRLNISREEFNSQLCTSLAQCNAIPTIFFFFVFLRNWHCLESEQDWERSFADIVSEEIRNIPLKTLLWFWLLVKNEFIPYPTLKGWQGQEISTAAKTAEAFQMWQSNKCLFKLITSFVKYCF